MTWNNHFLSRIKNLDTAHFTSDFGIKLRKVSHPLLKAIIKRANGKKCFLISYPSLEKDENYIFAAGHSFPGDVGSNLSVIDRNVYTLAGTTDQVDHNPQMNFLWANGMIYVNKLDSECRKEAYKKMVRLLNSGTSVMMFPEGVLNNSENLDCGTLYPGFYHLSLETGKKVVPIVANYIVEDNTVLIAASNPLSFENKTKEEAKRELRDTLATLRFNLSRMNTEQAKQLKTILSPDEFLELNHEIKPELKRSSLTGDIHESYLQLRKKIYDEVKWTNSDCFDEEIMYYKEHNVDSFEEVYSFLDKIDFDKVNIETISMLKPILDEKNQREKYDVKKYMKKNWNK